MATPFDIHRSTIGPRIEVATEGQLRRAIMPMITDREWSTDPRPAFVRRVAAIGSCLMIADRAATDDRTVEQLDIALDDRSDLAGSFAQLMAFSHAFAVNDERDPAAWAPLTKAGASKLIDYLGGLQFRDRSRSGVEEANVAAAKASVEQTRTAAGVPDAETVPAGNYAVDTDPGATNSLAFYSVDRPTRGRWAGYAFVTLVTGGGEQRMSRAASIAVLNKIAAVGAEAAMARYGHEMGRCGMCSRPLTNDESRARGIGPVCAEKAGW